MFKKLLFLISLLAFSCATTYGVPVRPPTLPKPVWFTTAEIFNNVFDSGTLTIAVHIDTASMVNVTGSTVTINGQILNDIFNRLKDINISSGNVTADVTGSTVTVNGQELRDIYNKLSGVIVTSGNVTVSISSISSVNVTGSTVTVEGINDIYDRLNEIYYRQKEIAVSSGNITADVTGSTVTVIGITDIQAQLIDIYNRLQNIMITSGSISIPGLTVSGSTVGVYGLSDIQSRLDEIYYRQKEVTISSGNINSNCTITSTTIVVPVDLQGSTVVLPVDLQGSTTDIYTYPADSRGQTLKVEVSSLTANGTLNYTGKRVIGFSALVESVNINNTAFLTGGFINGTMTIKDGVGYSDSFPKSYNDPVITVTIPPDTTGYFQAKYYE